MGFTDKVVAHGRQLHREGFRVDAALGDGSLGQLRMTNVERADLTADDGGVEKLVVLVDGSQDARTLLSCRSHVTRERVRAAGKEHNGERSDWGEPTLHAKRLRLNVESH